MSSVIGGAIFFQELENFTWYQWIFFPGGVATCICGVFLLSQRTMGGEDFQLGEDTELGVGDKLIRKTPSGGVANGEEGRHIAAGSSSGSIDSATESISSMQSLPTMGTPGTGQTKLSRTEGSHHKRQRSQTEPSIGSGHKSGGKKEKRRSVFQPNVRDAVLHKKNTPESSKGNPTSPSLLPVPIPLLGTEGHYTLSDGRNLLHDALTTTYAGITDLGLRSNYAETRELNNQMHRIPSEVSLGTPPSPRNSAVGSQQSLAGLAAAHNSASDLLAAAMGASHVDDRPIGPMPGTGGTGAFENEGIEMEAVGLELSFDGGEIVSSVSASAATSSSDASSTRIEDPEQMQNEAP